MKFNETEDSLLGRGNPLILLEPVKATITLPKPGTLKLSLLTHDGLRTEKTLPVQGDSFTLDGTRDQTPYYLIEF